MNEKYFQQEIRNSVVSLYSDAFFHKFTDVVGIRFVHRKPFDCIIFKDGQLTALELKQIKTGGRFSFLRIAEHQIENLVKIEKCGGKSFIVINYRFLHDDGYKVNKVFAIRISKIVNFIETGIKSLKYQQVVENSTELDRMTFLDKTYGWDIRKIL